MLLVCLNHAAVELLTELAHEDHAEERRVEGNGPPLFRRQVKRIAPVRGVVDVEAKIAKLCASLTNRPDAWSQRPLWGTNHVVSNVILENESPNGDVMVRSAST